MEAPAGLTRHRREVDTYLRSVLARKRPAVLYRMVRYHMGWEDVGGGAAEYGGKDVRSALCLLAGEAAGGDWRRVLPAAAAVELIHNFSLVHDDIQDRDGERRHRPTVWAVWGEGQAINAGDALSTVARLAVLGLRETGVPDSAIVEAARVLDRGTLEMVEGQAVDIAFEGILDVGVEDYMRMIEKKTGALFECALRLGGVASGAGPEMVEGLGRCGRMLGLAFQVRDDVLGAWGDPESTGKPVGADIRRRKKSLPVVFALSGPEAGVVRRAYERDQVTDDDVVEVLAALEACGAREYCDRVARERLDAALREIEGLHLRSGASRELREAAVFLTERSY